MARDAVDDYLARRRRRRLILGVLAVLLGTLSVAAWTWRYPLARAFGWHYDIRVERTLRESEASVLNGVDLAEVHSDLLPDWWIAQSRGDRADATRAATALEGALATDSELSSLFATMREHARDPWDNSDALIGAAEAWTLYLDKARSPWMIEANVMRTSRSEFFYVKSYEVVADTSVEVAGAPRRVRIVRRVDGTNLVEGFLGHAGTVDGGSLVALDRLTEFVSDALWPMLGDPDEIPEYGDETLRTVRQLYGPRVRAEIESALPADSVRLLRRTAATRARFLATVEDIEDRRHCSDVVIHHDWLGLPGESVAWAIEVARRDRYESCPGVRDDEARALRETTSELSGTRGLEEAVGDLIGWYARHTAIHEAQHVADLVGRAEGAALACPGCPPQYPEWGRDELSAYLSTFAQEGIAYASLLQACEAAIGSYSPAHMAAMDLVGENIALVGCQEPPPDDLVERARDLEASLFGRSGRPTVPEGFPTRILPTSGRHRRDM